MTYQMLSQSCNIAADVIPVMSQLMSFRPFVFAQDKLRPESSIANLVMAWIPACAGMTDRIIRSLMVDMTLVKISLTKE